MQTLLSDTRRNCYIDLHRGFLTNQTASRLFSSALNADFASEKMNIMGKEVTTKRQTIGFGDPGVTYKYTGAVRPAHPWPEYVVPVKTRIEETLSKTGRDVRYNYMLSTLYLDGGAGIGFHDDGEPEVNQQIPICSISLGAGRDFVVRDKSTKERVLSVTLGSGDLLVMRGATQEFYQHALPERAARGNTRVSWTFRSIIVPTATTAPAETKGGVGVGRRRIVT